MSDALEYHRRGRPGKIEVVATKPVQTQRDLSLAYSPGVAEPCLEIAKDPSKVSAYTARGNLVGVISNGTAVLGLGNIGPLASKPVMEGKAVLFKRYADIDVFDIEVDQINPEKFIEVVAALAPTFGGINLEDIRAPDCFRIERELEKRLDIPVFHDDQHGTAIISAAALSNSCQLQGKKLEDIVVVCIGAGAAALASLGLWCDFGVNPDNITLFDLDGEVYEGRDPINEYMAVYARPGADARRTITEALVGADVLIGLSAGNLIKPEMVKGMADKPIIFALANPDPEIPYELAKEARPDAIVGTGRSDFPNQVNNVLGFPYIFRGALDCQATHINKEMKIAAAKALANLAQQEVPDDVLNAYGGKPLKFGTEYIIPKPMDWRSLSVVASAVAEAAIKTGVARKELDIEAYREELKLRLSPTRKVMWRITDYARRNRRRIVFPEGEQDKILRAAEIVLDEGIAQPILLGRRDVMEARARAIGLERFNEFTVLDRHELPRMEEYTDIFWNLRKRRGLTRFRAQRLLNRHRAYYALLMLHTKDADGLVSGVASSYPETIRPALEIIGVRPGVKRAAGMYMVVSKNKVQFLADTTINIDPDAEALAEIATLSADLVQDLGITPRVAMLSFSNFGDAPHPHSDKVSKATILVKARRPDLIIDGEMQADTALLENGRADYPFTSLDKPANVLIFPNLDAGNIAYKLLDAAGADVIGPMVLGMRRPVSVLQQGCSVSSIVHMTAITVANAARHDQREQQQRQAKRKDDREQAPR